MIAELGLFLLIASLCTCLFSASYLFVPARYKEALSLCLPGAAMLSFALSFTALLSLVVLRLDSDFTVENVVSHSNLTLPTLYKIVGTWGNHEGSLLLWSCLLLGLAAWLAGSAHKWNEEFKPTGYSALALLGILSAGFGMFMVATSNPFTRLFPPPVDGQALNPLLQDIALAMHPPMLYTGYVGFAVVYALAVAGLLRRKLDKDWAALAHPWILFAWSSLTVGIGLGSWWAYRVLGWGGWWFWDPVENCSLLPWLAGTALMHANIVLKKRGALAQWVCVLSILTFGLALLGTFLVRSGVLSSVHSFASDPARGAYILCYIVASIGGGLLLFALRGDAIRSSVLAKPASREGLIVINNVFILCACATVLLGTLYPMVMQLIGAGAITVGAPYFNITFLPLMAIPLLFAGLTPFVPWQQARRADIVRGLIPAALAAATACLLVLALVKTHVALAAIGFSLSAALLASSLRWIVRANARKTALPVFIAHCGAALMVAGITAEGLWNKDTQQWLSPGQVMELGDYKISYSNVRTLSRSNHDAITADIVVNSNGRQVALLQPEYKNFSIRSSKISTPDIGTHWLDDIYLVIGDQKQDQLAVRAYHRPMIVLIWAGFMLMALGGLVALFTRKRPI